jgi:mannobiose 2-epimerase
MGRLIAAAVTSTVALVVVLALLRLRSCTPDRPAEPPGDGVRTGRVDRDPGEERAMEMPALRDAIARELHANLLPFWRERSLDRERGGFIGEMSNDGSVRADAVKGLILNARLVWTFAALYRALGDTRDRELATRAYAYLEQHFLDREHGGYVWRVDRDGRTLDRTKKIYGQAFCVYALAEVHLATGDAGALAAARRTFELIERHAHDERHGGYLEARAADWSPTAELRLGDGEPIAAKSMNNHLHLLEAYTNLYRAWPDAAVAARVRELIELFATRIVAGGARGGSHLNHFFDEAWRLRSGTYTYGHDIEATWLLAEAARALGDPLLERSVRDWTNGLAAAVLAEGVDADGGLAYEGRDGAVIDGTRDWWCQAEAVVGFWDAWEATGNPAFAAAAAGAWRFIAATVVDRENGEWFWRVRADGTVDPGMPKVSEWKCPYHTTRMCLEMMRRLDRGAGVTP